MATLYATVSINIYWMIVYPFCTWVEPRTTAYGIHHPKKNQKTKNYLASKTAFMCNLQYDITNALDTVQQTGPLKEIKLRCHTRGSPEN